MVFAIKESPVYLSGAFDLAASMIEGEPSSTFIGFDFHDPSIEEARQHAAEHEFGDRVRLETAVA